MSAPIPSTPQAQRKRALEKCDQCRRKKIKCTPEHRDFQNGQRCQPCINSGLPCSANTRCIPGTAASPTDTVATPYLAPMSPATESFSTISQQTDSFLTQGGGPDHMAMATNEISYAGGLIDLFHWCQIRRMALTLIQTLLPLFNIRDFLMAFNFFRSVIAERLWNTFRRIDYIRAFVSGRDKELLTRRLFDSITAYLSTHYFAEVHTVDIPNCVSVEGLRQKLRTELVQLYESSDDFAEADRILQLGASISSWSRPTKRLSQLSSRLEDAATKVLQDYEDIRKSLAPTGRPRFPLYNLLVQQRRLHYDKLPARENICFSRDITGRSHLHLAAEIGDLEHLRWLFENCSTQVKQELESRDVFGLTPLMIAAYTGNIQVLNFLESKGAEINTLDPEGRSILALAAMAGHDEVVSHILSRHPSMITDHFGSCSPLHDAVAAGHRQVVDVLLRYKAEPRDERPSHGGRKASQVAANHGHMDLYAFLSKLEDELELQTMTSPADPLSQQLHSLKEKINHAVARTQSPESGPSRSSTVRSSSQRPSKRQRLALPASHHDSPTSTFSISSTPAAHPSSTSPSINLQSHSLIDGLSTIGNNFGSCFTSTTIIPTNTSEHSTFSEYLDFDNDGPSTWSSI